mmetsp:Transcript_17131/g.45756  ORF Transcript_17131/g.45756 Transcript_17131/m.45756 type:complete len:85 (-) Transcript_17131:42-296(-)
MESAAKSVARDVLVLKQSAPSFLRLGSTDTLPLGRPFLAVGLEQALFNFWQVRCLLRMSCPALVALGVYSARLVMPNTFAWFRE